MHRPPTTAVANLRLLVKSPERLADLFREDVVQGCERVDSPAPHGRALVLQRCSREDLVRIGAAPDAIPLRLDKRLLCEEKKACVRKLKGMSFVQCGEGAWLSRGADRENRRASSPVLEAFAAICNRSNSNSPATLSSVVVSSSMTLMPSLELRAVEHLSDELVAVETCASDLGLT